MIIPALSDTECRQLLPLVRLRKRAGLFATGHNVFGITEDAILKGRLYRYENVQSILHDEDLRRVVHRARELPFSEISSITAHRGGRRTRLVTLKAKSASGKLKWALNYDDAEHFLAIVNRKLPAKLNINNRVPMHAWGITFLLLIVIGIAIAMMLGETTRSSGFLILGFSVLPLLIVQIYDHLPAVFPWEAAANEKKKKKPVKDRSGVEPYRSKWVGWSIKIASVVVLVFLWLIGLLILAPIPLVMLYLGNLIASVPPRLVRQSDTRPPILYLRSFLDDRKSTLNPRSMVAIVMGVVPPGHLPTPWSYLFHFHPIRVLRVFLGRSVDTSEEQLALFFRQRGPFVAIGKPGETFASPGASRMYVTNEEWQDVVLDHLDSSQVVLLQPAKTEGIWWEVEKTFRLVDPRRVLLCMVNFHQRQNDYEKFRLRSEAFLGCPLPRNLAYTPMATFMYFDAQWNPMVQQVSCRSPLIWPVVGDLTDLEYTLDPFLRSAASAMPSGADEPAMADESANEKDVAVEGPVVDETASVDAAEAPTAKARGSAAIPGEPISLEATNHQDSDIDLSNQSRNEQEALEKEPTTELASARVTEQVASLAETDEPALAETNEPALAETDEPGADVAEGSDQLTERQPDTVASEASVDFLPRPPKGIRDSVQLLGLLSHFAILIAVPYSFAALFAVTGLSIGMDDGQSDLAADPGMLTTYGDPSGLVSGDRGAVIETSGMMANNAVVDPSSVVNPSEPEEPLDAAGLLRQDGIRLYQEGQLEEAIAKLDESLAQNDLDPMTHAFRGDALESLGRRDEAVTEYRRAIEISPDYFLAWNNLGYVYLVARDPDQAITCLTKALELNPKHAAAYGNRGIAHWMKDQDEEALNDLTESLKIEQKQPFLFYRIGTILAKRRQWLSAVQHFNSALEMNPELVDAYLQRGRALMSMDGRGAEGAEQLALATKSFEEFFRRAPDQTWVLMDLAEANRRSGRMDDAIASVTKLLTTDQENLAALETRVNLYFEAKRFPEAMEDAERAAELSPDPNKKLLPASLCFAQENYEEAIRLAAIVEKDFPDSIGAVRVRANSLYQMGRVEDSIIAFADALKIDPNDAISLSRRAQFFGETGRYRESVGESLRLAAVQPQNFDPVLFASYALAAEHDWKQLQELRTEADQRFGDDPNVNLQMLLTRMSLLGPAPDDADWSVRLEKAASMRKMNPGHGDLAVIDGALHFRSGQHGQAEEILQQVVDTTKDPRIMASAQIWLSAAQSKLDSLDDAKRNLQEAKEWIGGLSQDNDPPAEAVAMTWWQKVELRDWIDVVEGVGTTDPE